MYVVNNQLELFMLTRSMMGLSHFYCWVCVVVWCLKSCGRLWSVCEVIFVPYMDTEVAVMRVLLFVLHVCMMRECEGDDTTGIGMGQVWLG